MSAATVLDQFLDPLSRCLDTESARRILAALGVPVTVQERVDTLAELANEGLLSDDERAEYEALINADDLVAILKLKARRQLSGAM
jgi:F420-dependent methylenetetrahydromethanopterin dehydrogenase